MEIVVLIAVCFHLYMLRWGQRAYWRGVYLTLAEHSSRA